MNRTIVIRAAALVLSGLFLIVAGLAGPARPEPRPQPALSWRPATEAERRAADRQQLAEQLDRLWEQRQQPDRRRQDLP